MKGHYKYKDVTIKVVDVYGDNVLVMPISKTAHKLFDDAFLLPLITLQLFEHDTRKIRRTRM